MDEPRKEPTAEEKVALARCRLLQKEPFFGHLLNFFRLGAPGGRRVKTASVWIDGEGRPTLAYNPAFIESLTVEETAVILRHEMEHIYRLHPLRALAWGKDAYRNHGPLNWAMDALVHGPRDAPFLEGLKESPRLMGMSVFLPPHIHPATTVEQLVAKLPRMTAREFLEKLLGLRGLKLVRNENGDFLLVGRRDEGEGAAEGSPNPEKKGGGLPVWLTDDLELTLERLDDHGAWEEGPGETNVKVILKRLLLKAAENAPGNIPCDLTEIIRQLSVPTVDWRRALFNVTGRQLGGSRRTYSRRNRRYNTFGVKGKSAHARDKLLVMVDTSCSVSKKTLEAFFTEIESLSSRGYSIDLVTFDAEVHPINGEYVRAYRRGDWRKITLTGRGGTSFINAFRWVDENRLWARSNIVLTDGLAIWPVGYEGLELIWCLSPTRQTITPPFGEVVRLGGENR